MSFAFGYDKSKLSIFDQIMTVSDIYAVLRQIRPYRPHSIDNLGAIEILNTYSKEGKIDKRLVDAIPITIRFWRF